MNPQVFGKEHLIYVIVCLSVGIVTCVLVKKFVDTEKTKCKIKQMFLLEQKNSFDEKNQEENCS